MTTQREMEMYVDELFHNVNDIYKRGYCRECNIQLTIYNYFYYCEQCCEMYISDPLHDDEHEYNGRYKCKKTSYTRRSYFIEKLKMMSGYKQSKSPTYNSMINNLKSIVGDNPLDINKLKRIMKDEKYNTHYKYIYDIYKDVTGVKIIDLTMNDICIITDRFIQMNNNFKIENDTYYGGRNNMVSYDLLIRNILKELNYDCYRHIIVPKKTVFIKKIYKRIKVSHK
jgi:hypothetical protein